MRKFIITILFLISISVFAQDNPTPPPISTENFENLQSVGRIDFEAYRDYNRYFNTEFETGWFAINDDASRVVAIDTRNMIIVWGQYGDNPHVLRDFHPISGFYYDENYQAPDDIEALEIIDITFPDFNIPTAIVYTNYETLIVGYVIHLTNNEKIVFPYDNAKPISIWTDSENDRYLWFEVLPDDPSEETYILRMRTPYPDEYLMRLPYAPAQDTEAIVRIGRIPPPYVVTSSIDGIVKLWNLETGEIVYEVDNGTGDAAVFGNINADATHLVWRDHGSNSLYLLNFETGENRFIDELDGAYVQWFFLSNDATVIIAVNTNFEPNIIVWDVETGERTILGEYRQCNRPQPDMARLSVDGTTLVIGCDTGLDIWRIVE